MNTKSVYQLDEEGYLVGQTIAFESPLEPGVYHIPRGCADTDLPLPELVHQDDLIKWTGTEWTIYNKRLEIEKLKLEEIQKIEDEKKRQEEIEQLEKEKRIFKLKQKKIQLLEELITTKDKLNTLSYTEHQELRAQISQLKEQ